MSDTKARTLTPKQERLARAYVELGCGSQAYREAYSVKRMSAHAVAVEAGKLLKHPDIALTIQTLQAEAAKRNDVSVDFVLQALKENLTRAMQAVPVLDRQGNPTGQFKYDGSVANKALELMGKHLGMWRERHEHTGKDGGPIATRYEELTREDVEAMTTPELEALAGGASDVEAMSTAELRAIVRCGEAS